MSGTQLVILTSLVAILRGLFTLKFQASSKNVIRWILDLILVIICVAAVRFYFQYHNDIEFYLRSDLRGWIQNNLGTFVFGVGCVALVIGFRFSLTREWNTEFLKGAYEWLDPFMMAGTIALILITFFLRTYYIPSESMVPTLQVHDYIIVAKPFVLKLFHDFPPHRGDIVVFHPPLPGETREYIKRVIGLPGETLAVHNQAVYINGTPLTEPYIKSPPDYIFGPVQIPQNNYIVFGDNRTNSEDSHAWEDLAGKSIPFLERSRIEGRAVMIFFPFNRVQLLKSVF